MLENLKINKTQDTRATAREDIKRLEVLGLAHDRVRTEIETAIKSDGYLVMITRKNGDRLDHAYFTYRFLRDDIYPSLEELAKILEPETKIPEEPQKLSTSIRLQKNENTEHARPEENRDT